MVIACTRLRKKIQWSRAAFCRPQCGFNSGVFSRSAGVVDTYPNSGAAVKCEGLDLPILQKHLQHIWDEQQRVVLEHCLEKIHKGKQSSFSAASVLHSGDKNGHGCILYIEINEPRSVS